MDQNACELDRVEPQGPARNHAAKMLKFIASVVAEYALRTRHFEGG